MLRRRTLHFSPQSRTKVGGDATSLVWKGWKKLTRALAFWPKWRRDSRHCPFCRVGQLEAARVSLTTRWGETVGEITGVPAHVCMDCGRYTLAPPVVMRVQDILLEDTRTAPTRGIVKLAYRRRRVRVNLPASLEVSEGVRNDVRVINLSPVGAMIEHAVCLSPGESCFLSVRLAGADLCVQARVVWSRVHGSSESPGEAGMPLFRSGLQFRDVSEEAKDQMAQYLARPSTSNGHASNGGKEPRPISDCRFRIAD